MATPFTNILFKYGDLILAQIGQPTKDIFFCTPSLSDEEMVANSFILEDNAHRTWVSASLGEPVELDPEVMAEVEEEFLKNRGPFGRIWALCESEAKEEGKE